MEWQVAWIDRFIHPSIDPSTPSDDGFTPFYMSIPRSTGMVVAFNKPYQARRERAMMMAICRFAL